ncbi:mobilization protein [Aliihoeflea sp. PC F10.4]
MARKSIEERLAQLDAQRAALKARLGKEERAKDTRRKVLLGALVLHRLETGRDDFSKNLASWLRRELPSFLTRDGDKELFDDLLKETAAAPVASGGAAST